VNFERDTRMTTATTPITLKRLSNLNLSYASFFLIQTCGGFRKFRILSGTNHSSPSIAFVSS
jgi:hypothetical protein